MASSEFDLIYRYLASYGAGPMVRLGVGDDAAVLQVPSGHELLVSTDTQVEGRHFPADTFPEYIATRAVGAAASDLAAMAATPLAMTLALTLPEPDELWMHGFSQGLARAVSATGLPLVGGDLTRGPLALSVTVLGYAPVGRCLTRGGASVGEHVCVTGTLGDAAAGLALLQGQNEALRELPDTWQEMLESRFYRPTARFEWVPWLQDNATACIDVSDGLLADVNHLASASGIGCRINVEQLPLSPALAAAESGVSRADALKWALTGGDDYELVFTVPVDIDLPPGATVIGQTFDGDGVDCPGFDGHSHGYDHFGGREHD